MADKDLVRDKEIANYRNFYCFPLKTLAKMFSLSVSRVHQIAKKYPYKRGVL